MVVDAQASRRYDVGALRDQGRENSCEYVSGAARGHAGIAAGIDVRAAVRRSHDGWGAFEDDSDASRSSQRPRRTDGIGTNGFAVKTGEPGEFSRVRRDDGWRSPIFENFRCSGERVDAVGVQNERRFDILNDPAHQLYGFAMGAKARTERDTVGLRNQSPDVPAGAKGEAAGFSDLGKRMGHCLRELDLENIVQALGNAHPNQPGAAPERPLRR